MTVITPDMLDAYAVGLADDEDHANKIICAYLNALLASGKATFGAGWKNMGDEEDEWRAESGKIEQPLQFPVLIIRLDSK